MGLRGDGGKIVTTYVAQHGSLGHVGTIFCRICDNGHPAINGGSSDRVATSQNSPTYGFSWVKVVIQYSGVHRAQHRLHLGIR